MRIFISSGTARCIISPRSTNQWYRKRSSYIAGGRRGAFLEVVRRLPRSALLYSGLFDTPIKQIVDRPEARAGLGCLMCHSIVQVKSTMGQGDFFLEYPKLHELAASENPLVRRLHDFIVRLNPEPHRRTFLKPFMARGHRGVLFFVPQGSSGRAGESLPVDSGLQ